MDEMAKAPLRPAERPSTIERTKMEHSKSCKYLAEFTGTFFLVFTIGCNVLTGSVGAALSIGGVLTVMIFALGSVSGAHFNPAVTLAILLSGRGKLETTQAIIYMIVQLIGGVCGSMTYAMVCGSTFVLAPVGNHTWANAVTVEALYSMALCYVVLNVATTRRQFGNQYFGLAIGFTVVSAALAVGGISGCSLNPAVSLGAAIVSAAERGSGALKHFGLYFFAPFLGSAMAAGAFFIVRKGDEYKW